MKLVLPIFFAIVSSRAYAQPIVITSDTTIDGSNSSNYVGRDVVVRGCRVTVNGTHTFGSLSLERNGANQPAILTHGNAFAVGQQRGMQLTVNGDLTIQGSDGSFVSSRIDVTGKGYPQESGPGYSVDQGGASHGGNGGRGDAGLLGYANGGQAYDSISLPSEFGSGGGSWGAGGVGGSGGGCINVTVSGTLKAFGQIEANGSVGPGNGFSGGGAGGTIRLRCGAIEGQGSLSANGSDAVGAGGGGGGGRISVQYASSSYSGPVSAKGGAPRANAQGGGAGSIYIRNLNQPLATLTYDNGGLSGTESTVPSVLISANVTVRGAARLVPPALDFSHWQISGNMSIALDGFVYADGLGFSSELGPGRGTDQSGAGHGGVGGHGDAGYLGNAAGGVSYGSASEPVLPGSGGGSWGGSRGGSGGGAVRLSVAGELSVAGTISARGTSGYNFAGGGSGGSLWISANQVTGNGSILAPGGNVTVVGGGGAGGRIAIWSNYVDPALQFTVPGGSPGSGGSGYGGTGTIVFRSRDLNPEAPNLLLNPGFEAVPNSSTGDGKYPNLWFGRGVSQEADTYSSDGSYGLRPEDYGNFQAGMLAHSGLRFMAAWTFFPDPFGAEVIEQSLASQVEPGKRYSVSAWLHQSIRNAQNYPGGYEVSFFNGSNYIPLAVIGPTFPVASGWQLFESTFIAPVNSNQFTRLRFKAIKWPGNPSGYPYPAIDDVSLKLSLKSTIHGVVSLADFEPGEVGQVVEVDVSLNGSVLESQTVSLSEGGVFDLTTALVGSYDIAVKGGHWLRQRNTSVDLGPGNSTTSLFTLTNGDCDHDNEVGIGDYALLSSTYSLSVGDPGYDTNADLNGDTTVDIADYAILSGSYGEVGD